MIRPVPMEKRRRPHDVGQAWVLCIVMGNPQQNHTGCVIGLIPKEKDSEQTETIDVHRQSRSENQEMLKKV